MGENKIGLIDKPKSQTVKDSFIKSDAQTIGSYIFKEKFVPMVQDFIIGGVNAALNMLFKGNAGSTTNTYSIFGNKYSNATKISYWTDPAKKSSEGRYTQFMTARDYSNVGYFSDEQARAILDTLDDIIQEYDRVKISDLYDIANSYIPAGYQKIPIAEPDHHYGWNTLRGFRTEVTSDGVIIKPSRPVPID